MRLAVSLRSLRIAGLLRIAVIGLLPLAGPAWAADKPFDVVVTADSTPVMDGPKPIGDVKKGTRLTVSNKNGNWYLIDVPGAKPPRQAWVNSSDVKPAPSNVVTSDAAATGPAPVTPEQRQSRLKERDQLFQQSLKLRDAGRIDEAVAADEQTLAIDREVLGNDHDDTLASLGDQAELRRNKGDYAGARTLLEEALATKTRRFGKDAWQTTDARLDLADVDIWSKLSAEDRRALDHSFDLTNALAKLMDEGKEKEALPLAKDVLDIRTRVLGRRHRLSSFASGWLASIYTAMEQFGEAEHWFKQTLEIQKEIFGERHPVYLVNLNNLASMYLGQGNYAKAEPLLLQVIATRKELFGEKDLEYAHSLNNLAFLYRQKGAYAKAEPLYEQAIATQKALVGEKNWAYATCLENLAELHAEMGHFAKAEPIYLQVLAIRKELGGDKHPAYGTTLGNLADLYQAMGKYAQAESLLRQALDIKKASQGETHIEYAICLNNLSNVYFSTGKYAQVEPLLLQAAAIEKQVLGEKNPNYATTLANLANVYDRLGEYTKAEPLYEHSLAIRKEVLGERSPDYAFGLDSLAGHYEQLGEYPKAESLYQKAIAIRKETLGDKHPDYATSLDDLSHLYCDMGEFSRAEPLLRQAIEIRKAALGEKHDSYASSLGELAIIYQGMGDETKAEPLFRQELETLKQAVGDQDPQYANCLHNLARLYADMGQYSKAEPLFAEALRIHTKVFGEKHRDCATDLGDLAGLYSAEGNRAKAEPLLRRVLDISKAALGAKHPDCARSLDSLGLNYVFMGDYAQAEPLFQEAAAIFKETSGDNSGDYANATNNLAVVCSLKGDYARAEQYSRETVKIERALLDQTAAVQSERQAEAMRVKAWEYLNVYLSITAHSKASAEQVYPAVLSWKGEVGARQRQARLLHHRLAESGNANAIQLAAELTDTAGRLAALPRQGGLSAAERQAQQKSLGDKLEQLEATLAAASADYRNQLDQRKRTPDDIRKALPNGAVLVDFLVYQSYTPAPEKGKEGIWQGNLLAFVVRSGAPVERVELGPEPPIETAIAAWRRTFGAKSADNDPGARLRQLLWQPLEKYIAGANTVLISPNGLTAPVPWGALPGRQPGTSLIDDVAVALVPIPQLLPELLAGDSPVQKPEQKPSLLLVGDVDFGADPGSREMALADRVAARGGGQFDWPSLPGTRAEVAAIQASFAGRFGSGAATELTGQRATKIAVETAAQKCEFLHFSTHGFFAPPEVKSAEATTGNGHDANADRLPAGQSAVSGLNPGLLSGLVLAGANNRLAVGKEDGILTALEVADLDLSHVRLATLSACETGLGQSAGGEGLLGLQRAFQTAGAKAVVASLWKVPDKATQLLMARFYDNLWNKKLTKLEALREAQRWLMREGGKQPGLVRGLDLAGDSAEDTTQSGRLSPRFWAAFELSGDWR